VTIADEYQVTSITKKCKELMMTWLQASLDQAKGKIAHFLNHAVYLRPCLRIIAKAHESSYSDVMNFAVKTIAKFGHILYNKGQQEKFPFIKGPNHSDKSGDETLGNIKMDCMNMFQNLSFEIKCKIFAERLLLLNDEGSLK
jgi:hypothetical protein